MAGPDLDVSHPSPEEVKAFTYATTALEATANTVRTQRDEIRRGASGNKINVQTSVLTYIEQKLRDAATKTAKVAAAMKVLREAGDTWLKVAPKKAEIEAAEKEVETAREVMAMAERMGVPSGPPAEKFEAAKKKLREMLEKRKSADEAYSAACKKAAGMVSGFGANRGGGQTGGDPGGSVNSTGSSSESVRGGGGGTPPAAPAAPKPTPAPTPAPGASKSGTGGGSGAPSPSKPGGTPAADTPSTSTSATPTAADQALAALLAQQQAQPQQGQGGAPATAGLPQQQAQQPKPAGDKSVEPGDSTRPIDSAALAAFLNTSLNSGDGPQSNPARVSSASPSVPSSPGAGTAFRPEFTAPKPLGGGGVPAQPAVTGTSVTGVQTGADVSGRSTPTPGAFSAPGAATSTSAAHGGPGEQAPTSSRPTGPGGTPVGGMPIGGMPMSGGGGGRSGKSPEDRGVLAGNPLLDGTAAVEAAVKHGTIVRKDDP